MGTRPRSFALIGQAIAAAVRGLWQAIIAINHRRQLADLLDAEDHQLADMGIMRDDLHAALSEPLWRDPTAALARRVGTRSKAADARRDAVKDGAASKPPDCGSPFRPQPWSPTCDIELHRCSAGHGRSTASRRHSSRVTMSTIMVVR